MKINLTILISIIVLNLGLAQSNMESNESRKGSEAVGEFTGTVNLNVPLATVSAGSLSAPVSLTYFNNGLRPNDVASTIGIGWSVNEVAIIYKNVKGMDDTWREYDGNLFCLNACDESEFLDSFGDDADSDGAYDLYTYNIMGYTGKFIFDTISKEVKILNKNEVKITKKGRWDFTVVLPMGVVVELKRQLAVAYDYKNQLPAWYPAKIYSYDKNDTLTFKYIYPSYGVNTLVEDVSVTEYPGNLPSYKIENKYYPKQVLTKIIGKQDSVTFFYEPRLDLSSAADLKCNKVRYQSHNICTDHLLLADYFEDLVGNKTQLRLNAITTSSCNTPTDTMPRYKFEYYGPITNGKQFAPFKNVTGMDAWGYYNGANTNSLTNMTPTWEPGGTANRSTNTEMTKYTTLKKVTYPSGGTTAFEYEQNTYKKTLETTFPVFNLYSCHNFGCSSSTIQTTATPLTTINQDALDNGSVNISLTPNSGTSFSSYVDLKIKNNQNTILYTLSFSNSQGSTNQYLYTALKAIKNAQGTPILVVGQSYIFELTVTNGSASAISTYFITSSSNLPAGGLRVTKITNSNGNISQDIVTNYTYENGVQYHAPQFKESFFGSTIYFNRTLKEENFLMDFNIGYAKVTSSKVGLGKVVNIYKADFIKQYNGIDRIITDKLSQGVGALLSSTVYHNDNTILSKDSFEYQETIFSALPANTEYFAKFGSNYYKFKYQYNIFASRIKRTLNYYYQNLISKTEYTYGHTHTIAPSIVKTTTENGNISETWTDYTNNTWIDVNVKNYFINKNIILPYTSAVFENSLQVGGSTIHHSFYSPQGIFIGNHGYTNASNILRQTQVFKGQYNLSGTQTNTAAPAEQYNDEYTADGFIKKSRNLNWPQKTITYDRERPISTDQNGFVTSTSYLGRSNLVQRKTNIDGTYTDYTYDGMLRIKSETQMPANILTEYFYNYYTATFNYNTVKTKTTYPIVAGSGLNVVENITYSDKLSRTIAKVAIKASPAQKDVLTAYEYDNYGRLVKEYMPVETSYNDGTYQAPGTTLPAGQVWKYKETKYEASPLSRPTESIAPDWYATKYEYGLNTSSDAVAGYAPNKLIKETVVDANGNRSINFSDFKGRAICTRKSDAADTPANRRDTYSYYDNKNRLVKVVPPDATTTTLDLIYEYKFDDEDKLIEKKIPGQGWTKYMYNNKDLLGAEQDANRLAANQWIVYSYDTNGRPLKSGIYTGTTPDVENLVFTASNTLSEKIYGTTTLEKDKVKTSKVNVLGTTNFLTNTYTFDTRGRVATVTSNNHANLAAVDVSTLSYDNGDNVLSTTSNLTAFADGANTVHNLTQSAIFDHRGRTIDDNFAYEAYGTKTNATYVYNYRNELVQLKQGKFNATTYLQNIDYTYRANGMLDKVNQYLGSATTGDLFYMEYFYDNAVVSGGSVLRKNGEIANLKWQRRGANPALHGYTYNEHGELTALDYSDYTAANVIAPSAKFDETFTYDKIGNIKTVIRKNDVGNLIDNLVYDYPSGTVRLNRVNDSGNSVGFNQNGQSGTGNIYTYDGNGNVKSDLYRSITNINYNHLDLPILIQKSDGSKLEMVYDAAGNLLTRRTFTTGSVLSETRDFIGNYEFINGVLYTINHNQGRYKRIASGVFRHEYKIADHLGNTRVVYADIDNSGTVEQSEILDENHYYAYGMEYASASYINVAGTNYNYKFNGIERSEAYNLDFAFYRGLDPVLGRWMQVDPKAEAMMGMSPYCGMNNNPVMYSDPNGDLPDLVKKLIGFSFGALGWDATRKWSSGEFNEFEAGREYLINAATFVATAGIGSLLSPAATTGGTELIKAGISKELIRAGAHGLVGGISAELSGGKFYQGAISGAVSSGLGSLAGNDAALQIAAGGLGGGLSSAISGGRFWQGFAQGIAVGLLNHSVHMLQQEPLKAHLSEAKTLDQWLKDNQGKSREQLMNERKSQGLGQPGGPIDRYVIDPKSGNVIDMRHFIIIGATFESFGNMVESFQSAKGLASAHDQQDYYSNELGYKFYRSHTTFINANGVSYSTYTFNDKTFVKAISNFLKIRK